MDRKIPAFLAGLFVAVAAREFVDGVGGHGQLARDSQNLMNPGKILRL